MEKENDESNNIESSSEARRKSSNADFFFKLFTKARAEKDGLVAVETEKQYSTLSDLTLTVPDGVSLEDTMFDFLRTVNMIEFKSENDGLNLLEYVRNTIRTDIEFIKLEAADYRKILTLYVLARKPIAFFKLAQTVGINFINSKERPWLWEISTGFQNITMVICPDLPVEEKYNEWLMFIPADSNKWHDYYIELFRAKRQDLLVTISTMRKQEARMVLIELADLLETPPFQDQDNIAELYEMLATLLEKTKEHPSDVDPLVDEKILSRYTPQRRMAGLKPEERVEGLKPEEQMVGLKPEERLTGLSAEERTELAKLLANDMPKDVQ